MSQSEEPTDRAETASVGLVKDEHGRQDDVPEEPFAGGAAEEGDDVWIDVVWSILADPGAECGPRNAVLLGVLTLG